MSQDPFDIPLFREIQRILASGEGPINFEIARQVAVAAATQGASEATPGTDSARTLADDVHQAEILVSGYTRLTPEEPMRLLLVNRSAWVTSTLEAWRWLLEHLAGRFTAQMGNGSSPSDAGNPMETAMGQVAPLLLGLQTGTLVGSLAQEALGRYDLPIPRDDDGRLIFVEPNLQSVTTEYGFDGDSFRKWFALHEAARHLLFTARPWTGRYARSLLTDLVDAIEIDTGELERRLMDLQTKGMEALQEGLGGSESALPITQTERHRRALDRFRGFVAVTEGYSSHAAMAVSEEIVPDSARIDEGMTRRAATPSEGQQLLASVLGISLDRELHSSGRTFCAAVVQLKGLPALNTVWDAPDNVPSLAEVRDPFQWMERVLA
ncbi:MAG TPA: zinc-dependent metalloprotease [Actinomycetota bacterium]|jgi:putative hydrolase